MATLYITEYQNVAYIGLGLVPVAKCPKVTSQTLTIGTETKSAAFNANTHLIRVHSDAVCSIDIDLTPEAGLSDARLAANQTEYFVVNPGDKLSVIANT